MTELEQLKKANAEQAIKIIDLARDLAESERELAAAENKIETAYDSAFQAGQATRPDWYGDVLAFHQKFGAAIGQEGPAQPHADIIVLRDRLHAEEYSELRSALLIEGDLPAIADAIVDLIYVLLGTAVSYGIDVRPIWQMVHTANMAKEGGATRADGKILKPEGWLPPPVAGEIDRQIAAAREAAEGASAATSGQVVS
jgi:predicted HAD superfamily Cof-like phosphohydrolase